MSKRKSTRVIKFEIEVDEHEVTYGEEIEWYLKVEDAEFLYNFGKHLQDLYPSIKNYRVTSEKKC